MRLKDWWLWTKTKPIYFKWFIIFILIRPIAEQFYNLKELSPLISPLYWLGTLTMLFSLIGILKGKRVKSNLDRIFYAWGGLIIISVLVMFISSSSLLGYLNFAIKLSLPIFIYFFLRVFIVNKADLVGLLTTFLISCIFPVVSILIGLSGGDYFSKGRFTASYADVFNNAFYISMGLIVLLYHFILNRTYNNTLRIRNYMVFLALVITLLGLWVIKHLATIVVLLTTLAIFIYISFRRYRGAAIFLVFISAGVVLTSGERFYNEVLDTRIERELEVIEGSRELYQGVHGRMSRWIWLTGEFKAAPIYAKILGYPYTLKYTNHMVGITPHNDFLRILFFTGYTGLIIYIFIIIRVYQRVKYRDIPDKFFLYSILMATVLYSITAVPTFYPGYVNILMIAFAYSALPVIKKT